jgi:hypothetical protein
MIRLLNEEMDYRFHIVSHHESAGAVQTLHAHRLLEPFAPDYALLVAGARERLGTSDWACRGHRRRCDAPTYAG